MLSVTHQNKAVTLITQLYPEDTIGKIKSNTTYLLMTYMNTFAGLLGVNLAKVKMKSNPYKT